MKNHFYLVSLRYTPGNWQHIKSFADCLMQRDYPLRLMVSSEYQWMNDSYKDRTTYTQPSNQPLDIIKHFFSLIFGRQRLARLFQEHPPGVLLLVMWHPLHFLFLRLVKRCCPGLPVIIWMHEPYKEDKRVYGAKAAAIYLIEFLQGLSLRYIDTVILHSRRALRLFHRRYPHYRGQARVIPLQFHDLAAGRQEEPRQFFSFLGLAVKAKGIESFFDLVEACAREDAGVRFQIVTRSHIQGYLAALSPPARASLQVINQAQISDLDMAAAAGRSLAVWALYKETMQSGVIPVALMHGTPVIGTGVEGLTEWLTDGVTGVIVSASPEREELRGAINYIRMHFQEMTSPCRQYYLATFDDGNWDRDYGWIRQFFPGKGLPEGRE